MKTIYNSIHAQHRARLEFFRGELVPAFEKPERADFVHAELMRRGMTNIAAPEDHGLDAILRVHSERYIDFLQDAWRQWVELDPANAGKDAFPAVWPVRSLRDDIEPQNFCAKLGLYSMDSGTPFTAGAWAVSKAGAHCALTAADLLLAGERSVFSLSRPPGHHAGADFFGGYCFVNNAAVAAQYLRDKGMARVAILDVDYHHGNGTQSIFYDRSDVLYASLHGDPRTEYPFYLGHADETGRGAGAGFNLNLPLPVGTASAAWFDALEAACRKVVAHAPDALIVSLGVDTFEDDPVAGFRLASSDYLKLGRRLAALKLPVLLVFEGGYAVEAVGVNAVNVIEGFEAG
jgi:acetoin utilization deacetylase AcuC-like enzyme